MGFSLSGVFDAMYWIIIALFIVINLVSLRFVTRPVTFNIGNHSTTLIFNLIAFLAYVTLIGVGASFTFAVVFAVVGLALGFGTGALSKVYTENSNVYLKRSLLVPMLALIAYVVSIYFAAFGGENLMSLGILLVIGATGLSVGSSITEAFRASNVSHI